MLEFMNTDYLNNQNNMSYYLQEECKINPRLNRIVLFLLIYST
jgi:hypothetical protein